VVACGRAFLAFTACGRAFAAGHDSAIFPGCPLLHFLICRLIADLLYGPDSPEHRNFTVTVGHEHGRS